MTTFDIDNLKDPLFNIILNSLNDGVLIADSQGYIKYVNYAYSKITGVILEEVIDKRVQDVRKGSRLPEVLQTGRPLFGIRRSVNQIEYIADINPIILQGIVVGAISIVRDITKLEELSKKLRVYSNKVTELKRKVKDLHRAHYTFDDIIGDGKEIVKIKTIAKRIAEPNVPVLILGESGTGKERFAHAIHNASSRSNDPFVAINCAAIPANLLLSEIFGYEEGAFTGATKGGKLGLFEIANGGTLFLDEIGDMDFELQSKLLRVIETGHFMRIGGVYPTKVDVRIISATNRDLEMRICENRFREDLYFRLNVLSIVVPPLRNRLEDIPLLVNYYLDSINNKSKINHTLSQEALALLSQYPFPGNVRELINVLEFAASTCEGELILPEDLPIITKLKNLPSFRQDTLAGVVRKSEKEMIVEALDQYGMSVQSKRKAAEHLGISLATLYNKIKQYGI